MIDLEKERVATYLSIVKHWLNRDKDKHPDILDNTIKQIIALGDELQEKVCGTSLESSTESSQET